MVAGGLLLVVAFTVLTVEPFGRKTADLEQIAWILALGLQLPAVWRLSRRMPPSLPIRVLGWVMGALVVAAVLACVFLGANNFGSGGYIVFFAWVGSVASAAPGGGGISRPRRTTVRGGPSRPAYRSS